MMNNQNQNNNYDEYDQKTSSSSSCSTSSSSSNQQEQILDLNNNNLESTSPPPNKKFAINNLINSHQQSEASSGVKLKPQQLIINNLNHKIKNRDLNKTNHSHHHHHHHQNDNLSTTTTTAASLLSTTQSNDFMQNLLLRTLTEILTNQLMLTRKVDLIKDNVDNVNRRLTEIEHLINNKLLNSTNEDVLSICNSETLANHHNHNHHHHSRHEKHLIHLNNNNNQDNNSTDNENTNDQQILSSPKIQQQQQQHTSISIQKQIDHHHHPPLSLPTSYSSIPIISSHFDVDNILHLDKEAETIVPREIIKRCIRKAKHRGNFAANLAAELFSKDERITCNCTGTRGKKQLSPRRLQLVKDITFQMYSCDPSQDSEETWRKECITAIDAKNRSIGRDSTNSIKILSNHIQTNLNNDVSDN